MSPEAAQALAQSLARSAALRTAFGAVLGFLLAGVFRLDFFFLPPLLAVQILALMRRPPSLAQGASLFFMIAVLSVVTLLVSGAFARQPLVYVAMVSLILFFGFLLDSAGRAMPATLVLMLGSTIPLVAAQSTQAASVLTAALIGATGVALLAVWAVFASFPAERPDAAAPAVRPASPRTALINLLLLLPVLLLFLLDGRVTFVVVIVIINIIRQRERGVASQSALGLLFGNVLGGALAAIAYSFVSIQSGPLFFLLVVLLVGLELAGRAATAGARAPVYTVALTSFIIVLGIGVSPLPMESGTLFVERLINVLLAGAYAVGAVALAQLHQSDRQEEEGQARFGDGSVQG